VIWQAYSMLFLWDVEQRENSIDGCQTINSNYYYYYYLVIVNFTKKNI
jgi:hypothetical protein